MTKEQIEQAQKYAKEYGDDVIEDDKLEDAFLAGAESRQAEIDALASLAETSLNGRWRKIPRDKDGFVEWDLLGLPTEGVYICVMCNGDYEVVYELCTESAMKYVVAVMPLAEYEP